MKHLKNLKHALATCVFRGMLVVAELNAVAKVGGGA
jgi:hypothetical protein